MSKSRAVLCSSCGRLINRDAKKCPHCGAVQPNLFGMGGGLRKLFGGDLDLVHGIVTACGALYIIALALDPRAALEFKGLFSIGAPAYKALLLLGMTGGPASQCGHWWTVLSAIFLHGSLLHIVFNSMWIRGLGPDAVSEFGPARFFSIFVITGAIGFFVSNLLGGAPTIGASGSIFGLMGLLGGWGQRTRGSVSAFLSRNTMMWGALAFVMGFSWGSVNNYAHMGGLASGVAIAWLLPRRLGPAGRGWMLGAVLLALGSVLAVGASVLTMWSTFSSGTLMCGVG